MYSFLRSALLVSIGVTVALGVTTIPSRAGDDSKDRIDKLERKIKKLEAKLQYVDVIKDPLNGLTGPHMLIEGCNVHVRSGSGSTSDSKGAPLGLGNLIVGYNEDPITEGPGRGGSHNLVVGSYHHYSNISGVVFGRLNTISGFAATVTGGTDNEASDDYTSISGGAENVASGYVSSVAGGNLNAATGSYSSVSGGALCLSTGRFANISGGYDNYTSGDYSCVSGGSDNGALGEYSSVSGGNFNDASGQFSSISGGNDNDVSGQYDWAAGALFQDF